MCSPPTIHPCIKYICILLRLSPNEHRATVVPAPPSALYAIYVHEAMRKKELKNYFQRYNSTSALPNIVPKRLKNTDHNVAEMRLHRFARCSNHCKQRQHNVRSYWLLLLKTKPKTEIKENETYSVDVQNPPIIGNRNMNVV